MQSKRTKDIIKALAYEFNMSEKEIYDIVKTPFDLLVTVIRNGVRETLDFPSVRIISFGTFYMSKKRREFFDKLNNKSNNKLNEGKELQSGGCRFDNAGDKT